MLNELLCAADLVLISERIHNSGISAANGGRLLIEKV